MYNFGRSIASIRAFITIAMIFLICANSAFANDPLEKKRKETHANVVKFKILESMETNKLYKNQQKLEQASKSLELNRKQYSSAEEKLTDIERELANVMQDYTQVQVKSKNRLRQIYKKQKRGMFHLLLSATDINSLLDRIYYQNVVIKQDKNRLAYLQAKSQRVRALRNQLEQQKTIIAYSIKSINSEQQTIKSAINRNEDSIQKYRNNRAYWEKAERELAKQSEALSKMINRNTKDSTVKVTSGFMKPIAGPVTSEFGYRFHPIFKTTKFHTGIDIGGPNGAAIRASNSGKVIYAGWYGGYGKVVILDHGLYNGKATTTLYAHMSNYIVSAGDVVNKGQTIGYEGSTGYSTGPHLHFEVRVDGTPQNPLNYI